VTPSKKPKSAKELYEKLVSDDVMDEESEEDDENDQGKYLLFLLNTGYPIAIGKV
jgi:hypothetical protein